jgi:hypothetical protein
MPVPTPNCRSSRAILQFEMGVWKEREERGECWYPPQTADPLEPYRSLSMGMKEKNLKDLLFGGGHPHPLPPHPNLTRIRFHLFGSNCKMVMEDLQFGGPRIRLLHTPTQRICIFGADGVVEGG